MTINIVVLHYRFNDYKRFIDHQHHPKARVYEYQNLYTM